MKRVLIFLSLCVCFCLCSCVYAANVSVQINGDIIDFTDNNGAKVEAQIINDRTMVPFRKIFNKLGVNDDDITWIADSKNIIAKKDNIEIRLQIDNNKAEKIIDGVSTQIILDSAPVIVNNRTLVPLRFIAESLGKTVAWDATNRTAVIIDYDYFMNAINSKSNNLYNFLNNNSNNASLTITRKYYDLEDTTRNDTAIVSALIDETKSNNSIKQNVTVNFSGTNELMKEILSEGWATLQFENNYYDTYITSKALNDGMKKIYGSNEINVKYNEMRCVGKYNLSKYDLFKYLCNIDEKLINVSTFNDRKQEFNTILGKFKATGNNLSTGSLLLTDMSFNYFDFTMFDNILCDSSIIRAYNFINGQIFNYDVNLEELCYDFPKINCTLNATNSELTIDFIVTNEYNEKVEYNIKIVKS